MTGVINPDMHLYVLVDTRFYIILIMGFIFSTPVWNLLKHKMSVHLSGNYLNIWNAFKYITVFSLFVLSYSSIANSSYNPFIYFRF